MIVVIARIKVLPQYADQWPELTLEATEATRAEPGARWVRWSRSVEDPREYVAVEAYDDEAAVQAHTASEHFLKATQETQTWISEPPHVINAVVPDSDWGLPREPR